MRITGGQARSIPLKVNKKLNLRPATDFLRESVFSSLGNLVHHATFLDLFAGTGAYGLEALSRGADGGVFCEKDRSSVNIIQKNLKAVCKSLDITSKCCQVCVGDVFKTKIPRKDAYDIIFIDPPYELYKLKAAELSNLPINWLKKKSQSRLVLESPGERQHFNIQSFKLMKRLGKNSKGPCALIYELAN